MKTLSVKNVPDTLHRRLKKRAKANRRSMNGELLALLDAALGEGDEHAAGGGLVEFLLHSPLRESGINLERDPDVGREVAL